MKFKKKCLDNLISFKGFKRRYLKCLKRSTFLQLTGKGTDRTVPVRIGDRLVGNAVNEGPICSKNSENSVAQKALNIYICKQF